MGRGRAAQLGWGAVLLPAGTHEVAAEVAAGAASRHVLAAVLPARSPRAALQGPP